MHNMKRCRSDSIRRGWIPVHAILGCVMFWASSLEATTETSAHTFSPRHQDTHDHSVKMAPSPPQERRRVNWFTSGGGWTVGTDGLNLTQWISAHRNAITGTFPCCGCWGIADNGTFVNLGRCASLTGASASGDPAASAALRRNHAAVVSAGLTIEPTGAFPVEWVMSEGWLKPGVLESAVAMLTREGWDGLAIDNEEYPPAMPSEMPQKFALLLGNLSRALADANKTTVVDVCSTWKDYVGGPDQIAEYAKVTPRGTRYMDMATYFATFRGVPHSAADMVAPFVHLLGGTSMAAPAVGLTEMPGHTNASCGGWPQCTNLSNPQCGCLDYGWNQTSFSAFVRAVEAAGVTEIDVWRQDMTPPPGTVPAIPPWLISELAGFLARDTYASER